MLSDRVGARKVMYVTLIVSALATLVLVLPASGTAALPLAITPALFLAAIFVLGFVMSLGKAAVYKHIPAYYPDSVGAVGGVVGMVGGLGGFILPIAFGALKDLTGLWSSCFVLLLAIVLLSLALMQHAVRRLNRMTVPAGAPAYGFGR